MNDLLTRAELCALLRISPKTSRRMDRDGTGPKPVRISPHIYRYPRAEVEAFVGAHGLGGPAEVVELRL